MALPTAPPLLLTKRLTTFLRANLSPQITSALLLMPSGRLLAYACQPAVPVSTLRTQGTVAASLWAIHSHGADRESIASALGQQQPQAAGRGNNSDGGREPSAVTMQLDGGNIVVIRRLRCGMLFVCIGPTQPADGQHGMQTQTQTQPQPPLTPEPHERNGHPHHHHQQQQQHHLAAAASHATSSPTVGSPSASEVESVLSVATGVATVGSTATTSSFAGSATAGIVATRRHAEALAVWLDDKLGTLNVPDESFGIA